MHCIEELHWGLKSFEEKKIPARSTERKDESIIKQGSLNYLGGSNNANVWSF